MTSQHHHRRRRPGRRALLAAGLVALASPASVAGYEIVTFDGSVVEARSLALVDGSVVVLRDDGPLRLPPGSVDFYETYRRNLGEDHGNVVWFRNGRFLRYEHLELDGGRVSIEVGDDARIVLGEELIDFRASVLQGGTLILPESAEGSIAVAKSAPRASRRSTVRRRATSRARPTRATSRTRRGSSRTSPAVRGRPQTRPRR